MASGMDGNGAGFDVKHGTGYADLACATTKLTSEITVQTKTGTAKVKATYRRSR